MQLPKQSRNINLLKRESFQCLKMRKENFASVTFSALLLLAQSAGLFLFHLQGTVLGKQLFLFVLILDYLLIESINDAFYL